MKNIWKTYNKGLFAFASACFFILFVAAIKAFSNNQEASGFLVLANFLAIGVVVFFILFLVARNDQLTVNAELVGSGHTEEVYIEGYLTNITSKVLIGVRVNGSVYVFKTDGTYTAKEKSLNPVLSVYECGNPNDTSIRVVWDGMQFRSFGGVKAFKRPQRKG